MTDKEKAVVMAYTGIAMLTGDKFEIFHKYVEEIMSRPVFTHELATYEEEIKKKAKFDFLALCAEEDPERQNGEWIPVEDDDYSGGGYWKCSECSHRFSFGVFNHLNHFGFCPNCGHPIKKEGGETNENSD